VGDGALAAQLGDKVERDHRLPGARTAPDDEGAAVLRELPCPHLRHDRVEDDLLLVEEHLGGLVEQVALVLADLPGGVGGPAGVRRRRS